ncbi:adenylyl-sulfate kinase [Adhaeribacter soli]|uniref:Adenylyl-sulfate kinase n=1 Tax=Adhaeribacter soli TaxID=2607655 RepID=A0A5N1IP51_9BACT|nr:adenylyl-sulfate kinase [Adhaeribacter soli]KAA9327413.1 adenylyl-sulfate kinase [Adhaeribacter soli]
MKDKKRTLLNQTPVVIWMTGLSGAGKSTIATELEKRLVEAGFFTQWLDGDVLRDGLTSDLGFSDEDRTENIRRAAEVAKLSLHNGVITICTFISPTLAIRELACNIIGKADFLEVYVNCPLETCVQRDVKGLYSKALHGLVKNLSGVDAPYEAPEKPWLELRTNYYSVDQCTGQLFDALLPRIKMA